MDEPRQTLRIELLPDHPDYSAPDAAVFRPAKQGDAGIDLVACEDVRLAPGQRATVSAGIRLELPDGVEGQVRPRSGRALREGLSVANAPGTIDPGYRGPVKVILHNLAPAIDPSDLAGPAEELARRLAAGLERRTIRVARGERIAQLVLSRFERPLVEIVARIATETERGAGGFGSTGVAGHDPGNETRSG